MKGREAKATGETGRAYSYDKSDTTHHPPDSESEDLQTQEYIFLS